MSLIGSQSGQINKAVEKVSENCTGPVKGKTTRLKPPSFPVLRSAEVIYGWPLTLSYPLSRAVATSASLRILNTPTSEVYLLAVTMFQTVFAIRRVILLVIGMFTKSKN